MLDGCLVLDVVLDVVVGFIASVDKRSIDPLFELLLVLCKAVSSPDIRDFFSVGCERSLSSMALIMSSTNPSTEAEESFDNKACS